MDEDELAGEEPCPHDWEDGYCLDCEASYYEVVIAPRLVLV